VTGVSDGSHGTAYPVGMREFIDGNTAVVRAAVEAGCDFFAGYPITPATSILLEAIRELPPRDGVAVQGEDEIASIGMCIAASMAGRRAMTATSGPGMSLFSESLGLAVMGEVPLVVVDVQRMGPATGGATTGADGDVQFARWAAPGGCPWIVLAPTDVRTCFTLTRMAFSLAERYRTPVILLSSKEIALTRQTVDLDEEPREPVASRPLHRDGGPYVPYRVERPEDVPDFSPVGGPHLVRFTTSMHDERGLLTGDAAKIVAKLTHLERKIPGDSDDVVHFDRDDGPGAPDVLVLAYGVAACAAREAVEATRAEGRAVRLLVPYTLWPVPERAIREAAAGCRRVVVPEHNFGQYAREVERVLPGVEVAKVTRIDGGLLTPAAIAAEVRR
jgi:2-oxoglutarate ferredoxin oxidoreductase subunit alpha